MQHQESDVEDNKVDDTLKREEIRVHPEKTSVKFRKYLTPHPFLVIVTITQQISTMDLG